MIFTEQKRKSNRSIHKKILCHYPLTRTRTVLNDTRSIEAGSYLVREIDGAELFYLVLYVDTKQLDILYCGTIDDMYMVMGEDEQSEVYFYDAAAKRYTLDEIPIDTVQIFDVVFEAEDKKGVKFTEDLKYRYKWQKDGEQREFTQWRYQEQAFFRKRITECDGYPIGEKDTRERWDGQHVDRFNGGTWSNKAVVDERYRHWQKEQEEVLAAKQAKRAAFLKRNHMTDDGQPLDEIDDDGRDVTVTHE